MVQDGRKERPFPLAAGWMLIEGDWAFLSPFWRKQPCRDNREEGQAWPLTLHAAIWGFWRVSCLDLAKQKRYHQSTDECLLMFAPPHSRVNRSAALARV